MKRAGFYLIFFLQVAASLSDLFGHTEPIIRKPVAANRIVWMSDTTGIFIKNPEYLLISGNGQADLSRSRLSFLVNTPEHKSSIILDYGMEMQGAIQIITGYTDSKKPVKIRVRMGESVSETMAEIDSGSTATNDHAMRDFELTLPWLGKIEIGNSGFRFVRIDLLEENSTACLKEINAVSIYRDIAYLGSFKCNDQLLNRIWQTGAYTVHLNMQQYLWDGIKRDRLVWVGDMHPEVRTILSVFGYSEVIPKSLDLVRDITPVTEWMNGISSYSMWWVLIHRDYYKYSGDLSYLKEQKPYLSELLRKFCSMVDDNGAEKLDGNRFLDWPSSPDKLAVNAGYQGLLLMTLKAGAELSAILEDRETEELCMRKVRPMSTIKFNNVKSKQAAALLSLADLMPPEEADEIISFDGAKNVSTFYGFYMLQAKAKAGSYTEALNLIREYWGGMLQLGATTFWEDFNIDWLKNASRIDEMPNDQQIDVHRTYGDFCYKGHRHSFCHGWASGPTSWLSEVVLGVQILEPGCRKIRIEPHLGDLEWVEGTYPTPLGVVKIRHEKQPNGKIKTSVTAPDGIEIIQ
ncbi:MAG: alpha-L-rhamnosidase C-terminal domain-containing protein [Bacteroidales bacterium]